jgi:AcrR family transcriptional regulator
LPRPALSEDALDEFRRKICDVSVRLFVEQGYEGFSLRSLAAELGCSHTTPYRYFADKDAIFTAVRAECFRRFASFLRARLASAVDPIDRLRVLARAYFDFACEQPAAFRIVFEMGQPHPTESPEVAAAGADAWSVLHGVVREAIRAGAMVGEPLEVAHTMWAGIHGVATLHLANKLVSGRSADATLDAMTDALVRAHLPSETRATTRAQAERGVTPAKNATNRAQAERGVTATKSAAKRVRTERMASAASMASAPTTKTRSKTKASTNRSTKGKQR